MRHITLGIVFTLACGLAVTGAQQKPTTVPITEAQIESGGKVYTASCAGCHGKELAGGRAPRLKGDAFLKTWGGKPVANLHGYISKNMPLRAPGSLSERDYLHVVSYLLSENGVKPGDQPLTAAALKQHAVPKAMEKPSN